MVFTDQDACAAPECGPPCSECANLCMRQCAAGVVVCFNSGRGIVTTWYAEHEDESGLILVNNSMRVEQYVRETCAANQVAAQKVQISAGLGKLDKHIAADLKRKTRGAVRRG